MSKILILFLLLIILSPSQFSQWQNQNPVPDGNHLRSVYFIDDQTGWSVGSEGIILKTTNSGVDWIKLNSGTNTNLKSVKFIDENFGWAAGDSGLIIKTTNGGSDWQIQITNTSEELNSLDFLNNNFGWAVGYSGTILKTIDGGSNWTNVISGTDKPLFSVCFVDSSLGWAVGGKITKTYESVILKTTDGGLTWILKETSSDMVLNSVDFINSRTGWAVGYPDYIIKTTNGGDNWFEPEFIESKKPVERLNENWERFDGPGGLRSVFFKDENNGWAVGGENEYFKRILATTDGGLTWKYKYFGLEEWDLFSVYVTPGGNGWAVGAGGSIFISDDDGDTWSQQFSGRGDYTSDDIYAISMLNEMTGWAVGSRRDWIFGHSLILKTTNSGRIWKTELTVNGIEEFKSVFFSDELNGWAAGDEVYFTTDGGESWTEREFEDDFNSVFFIDQDKGFLAGNKILKTTDGGNSWIEKCSDGGKSIYFTDPLNGLVVGYDGSILKSTDGGENWFSVTSGTSHNLNSIHFYNSSTGMCAGNNGTILLTSDGGNNWINLISGTTEKLNSIKFTNPTTVWIAGTDGIILSTTDLGNTWTLNNSTTTNSINSIFFVNENIGWAGGFDGTILKYHSSTSISHFNPVWSGSAYEPMNIFVSEAELIGGEGLQSGDEIAIFDGEYCVGTAILTEPISPSQPLLIVTSANNPGTPEIDGFTPGNIISYKFWLSSIAEEISDYSVFYEIGNDTFVANGSAQVRFSSILPVELISFTADLLENQILLSWQTATEINNFGFEVERSIDSNDWIRIAFVEGYGNSNSIQNYSYLDKNLIGGTNFKYRLKQFDTNGSYSFSEVIEIGLVPGTFSLYQNYPNPFNPVTKIRYELASKSQVSIRLYDILGSEVLLLLNEEKEPGIYELEFDANQLSSGTYIYQMIANNFIETKKMVLLK